MGIIAILAAVIRNKADLSAAIIGGSVALAAMHLPMKLGLEMGAVAGIAGGVLTQRMLDRLEAAG